MALEMISIDKTILPNLSTETIVYIFSSLMVNLGNTFRKCLKKGPNKGRELIKSLGSQTGDKQREGLNRGNTVFEKSTPKSPRGCVKFFTPYGIRLNLPLCPFFRIPSVVPFSLGNVFLILHCVTLDARKYKRNSPT